MSQRRPVETKFSEERIVATIGLTLLCGAMMVYTCGQHGIGWWFFGILLIY